MVTVDGSPIYSECEMFDLLTVVPTVQRRSAVLYALWATCSNIIVGKADAYSLCTLSWMRLVSVS